MIGSQRTQVKNNVIYTDCINEENHLEESFVFDNQLAAVSNGHLNSVEAWSKKSQSENYQSVGNAEKQLRSLYDRDIELSLNLGDVLLSDTVQTRIGSNVRDEVFSVEEILLLTAEMEKQGASEYEITEKCIPVLIKGQLSGELVKCLQKYTNVSDNMLVKCLKYFLNLNQEQNLSHVLAASFSSEQIQLHLRNELNFAEVIQLLTFIHGLLENDEFHQLDNVQFGDSYNADSQLLNWFSTIIDANYQQFILSRNGSLLSIISTWKVLIDERLTKLNEIKSLSSELYNLVSAKALAKDKQSSKWYSVEAIKLY